MTKKILKILLVALMILGMAIAATNYFVVDDCHAMKLVDYDPDEPDCTDPGTKCIDMTRGWM